MDTHEHFEHQVKKDAREHFLHLIQIALADGIIDITETEMLNRFGHKLGFEQSEINKLIESTRNSAYNPPYELSKRFEQVYDIVKMVLADGVIEKSEMQLANNFAAKSGFPENDIPRLLALLIRGIKEGKDEDELFEAYKSAIRNQKFV
jgi:uncharacterized tellurite resistance protein B-like protein